MPTPLESLRPKGAGNATVPDDAPIQPPQAFVDFCEYQLAYMARNTIYGPSVGIVHFDADTILQNFDYSSYATAPASFNLSGNALDSESVEGILDFFVFQVTDGGANLINSVIDISGGTNAAPVLNKVKLHDAYLPDFDGLYSPNATLNGRTKYSGPGEIRWTGTQWQITDGNSPIWQSSDDVATPDLATTWEAVLGGSADGDDMSSFSLTIYDKAQIIRNAGATVTTN